MTSDNSSQTYSESPPVLPYMFFNVLGRPQTADDLENNKNAADTTIEVTFYAGGATKLSTCRKKMDKADGRLRSLGFRLVFGPQQITNVLDTSICRYVARFARIIGSDDAL